MYPGTKTGDLRIVNVFDVFGSDGEDERGVWGRGGAFVYPRMYIPLSRGNIFDFDWSLFW